MKTRLGPNADESDVTTEPVDLRLVPSAAGIWLGTLAGLAGLVPAALACVLAVVAVVAVSARTGRRTIRLAAGVALAAVLAGAIGASVRVELLHGGPVAELAARGATATVHGVLTSEPAVRRPADWTAGAYATARLRVERVASRGIDAAVRSQVLLIGSDWHAWQGLLPGTPIVAQGRLAEADGDVAAFVRVDGSPTVTGPPSLPSRATKPFRAGLRAAVADLPEVARGLVPGMAVGDESLLPGQVRDDMRATGLTHLTAVSGVHVSIVLVASLGLARWVGGRGYALPVVAIGTIIAFAMLVRPDPSVVRASVMGLIGVAGLTVTGRKRALPALAGAVVVLLLIDPWLGRSIGFALSVLSTAGILVLAPVWRDAMPWAPRTVAEGVAVPLAAQVASIPVLVGFVSETSLASVPANVLVAPAVAPATLLGVATAIVAPVSSPVASVLAWLAQWPATWIGLVAEKGADQPGAVVYWPGGQVSVGASVALVVALIAGLPRLVRRPLVSSGVAIVALVVMIAAPAPGWPPHGWLVTGCPVGQGDAFVLNVGPRSGVVVDTGPDPDAIDRCLRDLGVEQVPLVVLTHFHADHVLGLPGVLRDRWVGEVLVSPLREPAEPADEVDRWLAEAGLDATVATAGDVRQVGEWATLRVVWPARIIGFGEPAANDASVVLDADLDGTRILLTGDIEPPAQRALHRLEPDLRTDVLKVPHHGSRFQEPAFLQSLGARIALIGVGEGNRHGHPAPETLDLLADVGMTIARTDVDGAIAVVRTSDGHLGVATRGADVFTRMR